MEEKYDSRKDTFDHKKRVAKLILELCNELVERAVNHDNSKLESPEKEYFDIYTPQLKKLTYGTEEYKESLKNLKVALTHHYENNSHHPEYYKNGINDMSLIDVFELIADWKASTERHDNGDILKSLEINKKRFKISDQLYKILKNTINEMKWISENKNI